MFVRRLREAVSVSSTLLSCSEFCNYVARQGLCMCWFWVNKDDDDDDDDGKGTLSRWNLMIMYKQ